MNRIVRCLIIFFISFKAQGQDLYIRTFGNPASPPVIFLHGGPGYNSAVFEASTAQKLSENGFFVIIYDRRGEGRSRQSVIKASYTFQQSFDDLNTILKLYSINNISLIGHSFGGILATLFAEKYPDKVRSVILLSAPVSMQQSLKTILNSVEELYKLKKDSANLKYISMLKSMDSSSLAFASYTLGHAMSNGFYTPKQMTEEGKAIYLNLKKDSLSKYISQMSLDAPQGFWKQERYTTIDLSGNIKTLVTKKVRIYALYGKDDGLYSAEQVSYLQNIIGNENLKYLDNCSHNVFIDRQSEFIRSMKEWAN